MKIHERIGLALTRIAFSAVSRLSLQPAVFRASQLSRLAHRATPRKRRPRVSTPQGLGQSVVLIQIVSLSQAMLAD